MLLWQCCTQYARKFGELSSGRRTGKHPFSFQSERKAMPKNAQTTSQLHSSHMLAKECSNPPSQASTEHAPWTSRVKLSLEKAEEPEIKLPTSSGSLKRQGSSRKISTSTYWLCQSLWLCGSQQTVENSERDGNTRPLYLSLEKSVCKPRSNS